MEKFKDVVGANNYYETDDILESYSKDHSFVPPRKPLAIIKPKNNAQIKAIIDLANESKITLIPTSSGFPKFNGDTVPSVPGIIVDLSDLNKVLRVDRRNRVAIIEPGVTFHELRRALEDEDMVPYTPLLPRSTKSVLASFLERDPILIPKDHWAFEDPIAGGEVVIGDSHIQGFGDSAQFSKEEVEAGVGTPVIPMGPSTINWLTMIQGAQGTLGIVRWASIRCRIKPSIQRPFFVEGQDLNNLLPFVQKILRSRIVDELFILNSFGLASVLFEETNDIEKVQAVLPTWTLFFNIAGYDRYPEEEIEWKEEQAKEWGAFEGMEFKREVAGVSATVLLRKLGEVANKDRKLRYKESCQVLPFSTTLDKTTELMTYLLRMSADYKYPSANLSIYIQPVIQGCQCECEVVFPYNPEDMREVQKVKNLFISAAQTLSHMGAYYSRPYGKLTEITYKDMETINILRKIKELLDPNDIMNSGKLY